MVILFLIALLILGGWAVDKVGGSFDHPAHSNTSLVVATGLLSLYANLAGIAAVTTQVGTDLGNLVLLWIAAMTLTPITAKCLNRMLWRTPLAKKLETVPFENVFAVAVIVPLVISFLFAN